MIDMGSTPQQDTNKLNSAIFKKTIQHDRVEFLFGMHE